jgi:hypothetical protein
MHPAIGTFHRPAPATNSSNFGKLRADVLLAHLTGQRVLIPHSVAESLDAWAQTIMAKAQGPALGLGASSIPPMWSDVLAQSGVPLSKDGPLMWGRDVREDDVPLPIFHGDCLVLPPPTTIAQLTSLALKPLRLLVTKHLNVRLQAATGLQLFLWTNQALIISHADVPLGGFLHGPRIGMRHSISVDVGGAQVIEWDY